MGSALEGAAAALLLAWPRVPKLWFVQVAHGSRAVLSAVRVERWAGGEEGQSGLSLREDGDGTAKVWLEKLETTILVSFGINLLQMEKAPPPTHGLVIPCLKHVGVAQMLSLQVA